MVQVKTYKVIREPNVMVPMRDGTRLATDVFRPDAPGRFPVLVNRGPYGKDIYIDNPDHSTWFFPKYGYVLLSQDCRARFGSEGESYDPVFQEAQDGFDTVEWAARQAWSNGRVGTTGQSYLGATQYTLATCNPLPPHLQAMAPFSAASDFHQSWVLPHRRRHGVGLDGALRHHKAATLCKEWVGRTCWRRWTSTSCRLVILPSP